MVRTRIAPSPTGNDIHIGNLYTAMINYCFAKKNHGQFVVRIEDTDRTRLVQGAETKILASLRAFGIEADESPAQGGSYGPYRQSDRLEIYQKHAQTLVQNNAAYYCVCSKERLEQLRSKRQQQKLIPRYDKYCFSRQDEIRPQIAKGKPYVIRLNVPVNESVHFSDLIRGEININTNDLDDQVLLKSDGYPTYHLAVVVDDYLMKISHVIRAEEWLPSTPKHVLLYRAFGWDLPVFAHVPILRNPDRSKLSKRKNPVWASWYLEQGFLAEAVLNYLGLMGWAHPDAKEIFDLSEFQKVFELADLQKTGPVFDPVKLEWMNGEHIRALPPDDLKRKILNYLDHYQHRQLNPKIVTKTIPLIQTRLKKFSDYWPLVQFIFEVPNKLDFPINNLKQVKNELLKVYEQIKWNHIEIYKKTEQIANQGAMKPIKLYMEIRYALANRKVTAPLFESMEILGKEATIKRLKRVSI